MLNETLHTYIENSLSKQMKSLSLYGKGMCNDIWLAVTDDNHLFLIKQAREKTEEEEQNDLLLEARLIQKLKQENSSLCIPDVVFASESPRMYGYKYVAGDTMRDAWPTLAERERMELCESLGRFHSSLQTTLREDKIIELGITNNHSQFDAEEIEDLERFIGNTSVSLHYRQAIKYIFKIFASTNSYAFDRLCHNDTHFENILVYESKLACVVDFGDADFGDVHREFTRYYQDFPDYFEHIVHAYETDSGHNLSHQRIKTRAMLDIVDELKTEYFASGKIALIDRFLNER